MIRYIRAKGNQTVQHQCQLCSAQASHFQQVRKVKVSVAVSKFVNLSLAPTSWGQRGQSPPQYFGHGAHAVDGPQ